MNATQTAAVDIMIRTSMGDASASFRRELDRMERDARAWASRMKSIMASVQGPGGLGSGRANDPAMKVAMADMARMKQQRLQMESDITKSVQREAIAQSRIRTTEWQKGMDRSAAIFDKAERQMSQTARRSDSVFSGAFWGTAAGFISSYFIGAILSIPGRVKDVLDQAVSIAEERQNALKGLASVATAKGFDDKTAQDAVKNLRLVKAGVVDIGNATTGLKNLLATGFSLPESIKLLEAFSDTAAFGKQQALTFGEAIRGATEGIKNGNSILVDNVGLTKNLSVILKEAGKDEKDLMLVSQDLSVRQALLNGLLKEASINLGDADKLTQGYTGSTAALNMAYDNLYASVGDVIIQSPSLIAANKAITETLTDYTKEVNTAESETQQFVESATDQYARLKIVILSLPTVMFRATQALLNGAGALVTGWATIAAAPFSIITGLAQVAVGKLMEQIVSFNNWVADRPILQQLGLAPDKMEAVTAVDFKDTEGAKALRFLDAQHKAFAAESVQRWNQMWRAAAEYEHMLLKVDDAWEKRGVNRLVKFGGTIGGPKTPSAPGMDTGKTKKPPKESDAAFRDFFEDRGFSVNRTFGRAINKGSLHPSGMAADVNIAGKSPEEIFSLVADAIEKGYRFYEERLPRKGVKQTGAHLHFERGGRLRASSFLGAAFYGGQRNLDALRALDAERLGKSGASGIDIDNVLRRQSEQQTKAEKEAFDQKGLAFFKAFPGMASGDQNARAIGRLAETEAQKRGIATPQSIEDQKALLGIIQKQAEIVSTQDAKITDQISKRKNLDEQYLAGLEESYQFNERIEKSLFLQRNYQEALNLAMRDSVQSQKDMSEELEFQSDLLARQNADERFINQRRLNMAKAEELELNREIMEVQDQLATFDINSSLKIQAALLRDILDMRGRELNAVISINRSQLEIAQQTEYSATQANARVLEFMASQKGVTETMGDFKIGLLESGYDILDRGLDKIIPKMGRLGDAIKDLLGSLIRLALNSGFRRLFGLDAAPASAGGAGNIAGGGFSPAGLINQILSGQQQAGQGITQIPGAGIPGMTTGTFTGQPIGLGMGTGGRPVIGTSQIQNIINQAEIGTPTIGGTPTVIGQSGTFGTNAPLGVIQGPASGGRGLSQAAQSQLMGAIMGGSIGASFGGSSATGGILGAAGGIIGGTLLTGLITSGSIAGATTGGIFGASAGLFGLSGAATFGIGAAIAGGLMLASWLFGRSKKRAQEKKQVTQLSGDAIHRIQQLITDVKAMKLSGAEAYNAGVQIRDQFQEQIKSLTTSPGKRQAQAQLTQINQLLGQLKQEGDKTDRMREIAVATDERLVPTFASGGFSGFGYGSRMVQMHAPEVMLNSSQIMALGGYREVANRAQVPGINMAPMNDRMMSARRPSLNSSGSGSGSDQPIYVIAAFGEEAANQMLDKFSTRGVAKKVRVALANEDDEGLTEQIINSLSR